MYHYTYLITYIDGKKYMGVRSCTCLPEEDVTYLGSSKHTPPKDSVLRKDILAEFTSRKDALNAEILYHQIHNVASSEQFYNRAAQTSTGFDTTGSKFIHSLEHREKIKQALTGRKRSTEECMAISKAKKGKKINLVHTKEFKEKLSEMHKGKSVSKETIDKMVNTRKSNGSYKHTEETKVRIQQALLRNPPYASPIKFTKEGKSTEYISIADCSRITGISAATIKSRLNRGRYSLINGWAVEYTAK